ncbi:MAG TPA: hypothetical protein G4O08_03090, partial [Anaerolineae bacterium]|nr:hypothetical protein [Anaerolineae bacterium]
RVSPRDIDILAINPAAVFRFAELMAEYTPERCKDPKDHSEWYSSEQERVSEGPDDAGRVWTFARWILDGLKVEVAHIAAPEGFKDSAVGAGIWEAGPESWPHIRRVRFRDHRVPVVPLEIQLETCLRRGLEVRVSEIVGVLLRDGYNHALIESGLSKDHLAVFRRLEAEYRNASIAESHPDGDLS